MLEKKINGKNIENIKKFLPLHLDLRYLPSNSVLIKIFFKLKKLYTSKNDFSIYSLKGKDKIFENTIVRDKFTGYPIIKPSTWKGHLRFAANQLTEDLPESKKEIMNRLFGTLEKNGIGDNLNQGNICLFPTFFQKKPEKYVITPINRKTRTPTKGAPITLEVMNPESEGIFYLLMFSKPSFNKGEKIGEKNTWKTDLVFLSKSLKKMFYELGFSAKKTSGFGVIKKELVEGKMWIKVKKDKNDNLREISFQDLDRLIAEVSKLE